MKRLQGLLSARPTRCLDAAAEISSDLMRADCGLRRRWEARIAKRARGILSREVRQKRDGRSGKVKRQRFTDTRSRTRAHSEFGFAVDRLCKRVYELADTTGWDHLMLLPSARRAVAAGP
ncbi:MAG: hypothetical protein ACLSAF_19875 [Intestinimonas sp.]